MPPEEMESLVRDYRSEGTQLEELNLEDDYHKVRELALHDIM
jgi:nuclear pore complex protein Nup133